MNASGMPVLASFLGTLLIQLPLFIVWLVGIVLAVSRWGRHRRASALLVAGLAILGALALLGAGFGAAMPWLVATRTAVSVGVVLVIANVIQALLGAAAWVLVLMAVFADRAR